MTARATLGKRRTTLSTPPLTRAEGRALLLAAYTFTGAGRIDPTFKRLARWRLVRIERANTDEFWFAVATRRGRDTLTRLTVAIP